MKIESYIFPRHCWSICFPHRYCHPILPRLSRYLLKYLDLQSPSNHEEYLKSEFTLDFLSCLPKDYIYKIDEEPTGMMPRGMDDLGFT
ncbi:hypothetical protein K1719_014534 [Acacia pycnantha]|nr:hypothetical protein K1719_014534 [Acacia pycnantha]